MNGSDQFELGQRLGSMEATLAEQTKKIDALAKTIQDSGHGSRLVEVETKVNAMSRFAWMIVGGMVTEGFAILWLFARKLWTLP